MGLAGNNINMLVRGWDLRITFTAGKTLLTLCLCS